MIRVVSPHQASWCYLHLAGEWIPGLECPLPWIISLTLLWIAASEGRSREWRRGAHQESTTARPSNTCTSKAQRVMRLVRLSSNKKRKEFILCLCHIFDDLASERTLCSLIPRYSTPPESSSSAVHRAGDASGLGQEDKPSNITVVACKPDFFEIDWWTIWVWDQQDRLELEPSLVDRHSMTDIPCRRTGDGSV
ncbi:hypothetical protein ASPWEDRAFT_71501 [Aspergillus wentii DTO 134E9]|uniref:Uncharacterized protein n=1 Tax=Aspergillus wentii DTO 134E9 TaxID=1073089 RepID=A0A1L9RB72_ASPWE|nr:uncharacterized protein ASPWEDRAFT_71501 [Aspergillus wentii DTO 134E9]OJJ32171.1 hypothetical protein ASPWEDRAFT_71501 [Aspergillus wentii DTO 134E9]